MVYIPFSIVVCCFLRRKFVYVKLNRKKRHFGLLSIVGLNGEKNMLKSRKPARRLFSTKKEIDTPIKNDFYIEGSLTCEANDYYSLKFFIGLLIQSELGAKLYCGLVTICVHVA